MLKKAVSIFMVVVMLLSMSITAVVFADGAGKGNQLGLVQGDSYGSFSFDEINNGFAGKLTSDNVPAKITMPVGDSSLPVTATGGSFPQYKITHGFVTSTTPLSSDFTFQANVYADGEAVVGIASHWNDFFRWDKDGKLYVFENSSKDYDNDYESLTQRHVATLERGRWHTIALTIHTNVVNANKSNDYMVHSLYVDGSYVCDVTRAFRKNKHQQMKIGAYAGSGAGVIAIDDVYAYAGAYDATNEVVAPVSAHADLTVDSASKTIACDADAFADAASFNEAVKTAFDANYAILYDAALTTPATAFDYGVVAINSKNGIGYDYYTVADKIPEPVVDVKMQIEEKFDDEAIDAQLVFDNIGNDFKYEYQGNLGGKSAADKALVISAIDATLASAAGAGKEPKIKLKGEDGYADAIVTVEADVYKNDIATESRMYMRYYNPDKNNGQGGLHYLQIVKFQQNGQININNVDVMAYKPNRWYKVAATLDRAKHGFDVYINGKLAGFAAIPEENKCTTVANAFYVAGVYNGLNEDTNSTTISTIQLNSITAVDNFRVYLSAYDSVDDDASAWLGDGEDDDASVFPGALLLNGSIFSHKETRNLTKDMVREEIFAHGSTEIYSDGTYATPLADTAYITADSVLVSTSRSGEVFEYYNFSGGADDIEFSIENGKITASALITAPFMFIIAEYNDSNELMNVSVAEDIAMAQTNSLTIDYTQGNLYKAFVWSVDLVPVRYIAN